MLRIAYIFLLFLLVSKFTVNSVNAQVNFSNDFIFNEEKHNQSLRIEFHRDTIYLIALISKYGCKSCYIQIEKCVQSCDSVNKIEKIKKITINHFDDSLEFIPKQVESKGNFPNFSTHYFLDSSNYNKLNLFLSEFTKPVILVLFKNKVLVIGYSDLYNIKTHTTKDCSIALYDLIKNFLYDNCE